MATWFGSTAVDDALRAYVDEGEGCAWPPVGDLWPVLDATPPALREWTLGAYILASERRLWAWDALTKLLAEAEHREPEILKRWACDVVSGRRVPPPRAC